MLSNYNVAPVFGILQCSFPGASNLEGAFHINLVCLANRNQKRFAILYI